jgi:acetate---CoA ligase (ADP-forming)
LGHLIVDVAVYSPVNEWTSRIIHMISMEKFFFPESVVVFGVSPRAGNIGKAVVENLQRFGFGGRVYGLGRYEGVLDGVQVYDGIESLPETPDLAVILVPAAAIADALTQCGKRGITNAVIETAGFSELGSERQSLEIALKEVATAYGIACMGPNCLGVVNTDNGLCLPFVPSSPTEYIKGRNAFISQSGGLLHEIVRRCMADNVGLTKLVSIGNKLLLNECAVLSYLLQEERSAVIGIYLEDIRDGRRLMNLAAASTKPVILLKGNASPTARQIAQFHTSALVGDEAVTKAALKQAGIHQVKSLQEMIDAFKIFSMPPIKGSKIVLISRSGGQSVLLADYAHHFGFTLAQLPAEIFDLIKAQSKGGVIKRTNPIDLGDVYNEAFYLEVVDLVLREDGVDGVAFFFDYELNDFRAFEILEGVERLCRIHQKPVMLCMVPDKENWFKLRFTTTFPFFTEPERGFAALKRSIAHYRRVSTMPLKPLFDDPTPGNRPRREADMPRQILGVPDALALACAYGIPVVDYRVARTAEEAVAEARHVGYPVVLKRIEPQTLHKTETGAVVLGISDDDTLKQTLSLMTGDLYLIQKMAPTGVETIIGGKWDDEFGPVVVFGLGGIFAEALRDVAIRVAPIDEKTARQMINEIRGRAVFTGFRMQAPRDVDALAAVLVSVSRLLAEHSEIVNLDINPFVSYDAGKGGLALDIKIEIQTSPSPGKTRDIP